MAIIAPELTNEIIALAQDLAARFAQSEFIPGCEVLDIADINLYAANNGWIEARCGHHNQQRVRWKLSEIVEVGDFIDVIYFPGRRVFEVWGVGGSSSVIGFGTWPFDYVNVVSSTNPAAQYATLAAAEAAVASGETIWLDSETFTEDVTFDQDVIIRGLSKSGGSIVDGKLTLTGGGTLKDILILPSSNATAVEIDTTGAGYHENVQVINNNGGIANCVGFLVKASDTFTNCDAQAQGSSTGYGVKVAPTFGSITATIIGGVYSGQTAAFRAENGATIILIGPQVATGTAISTTGTGTVAGWYVDSSGAIHLVGTGGTSQYVKQSSANAALTVGTIPSDDIQMPKVGSPTIDTLTEDFTTRGSSGVVDGTLTYVEVDTGLHKVKVAAGEGYLRTTNDQQGELKLITWSAVTQIDIPAPAAGQETVRFIGIEYNAGTPQVTTRTTFNWNWFDDFPLARVSYDGTTLRILNAYAHTEDTANFTRKYLRLTHPFIREEAPEGSGGLEISDVATRQLAMTAGNVWHGFNRYILSAVAAGTAFDTHYQRSGGGFNSTTGVTQWPNTQYDDGSGTLVTMTNNKYACLWVYVDVSDGSLDVMYGRGEYTSVANAQAEGIPTTPGHLTYHGRLLGRIIFQKSAAAASLVESAWRTVLAIGSVGDHTLLTNLNSTNYYHLTNAEYTDLTDGGDTTLHSHSSISAKNTSGATAAANEVGYLVFTAASGMEYKTTTTAIDDKAAQACVVTVGAANSSTIKVMTRGRFTIPYTGTAPNAGDYLVFSATAAKVQQQTTMRPEVLAIAMAAGSGGTVDALLLTGRAFVPFSSTNDLLALSSVSSSDFVTTQSGATSGATVTYGAVTSGNENAIVPTASTQLANILLWNTTRSAAARITAVNTGTNVITVSAAGDLTGWLNTDALTTRSQTNTDTISSAYFYDIEVTSTEIPALATALQIHLADTDSAAGKLFRFHPYVAGASSKRMPFQTQVANQQYDAVTALVPLISKRFTIEWEANGAGSRSFVLRCFSLVVATP